MVEPNIKHVATNVPSSSLMDYAATVLKDGGIVVAPTETRYGLLVRADQMPPIKRLYEIKKRSLDEPIAVFVGSIELMMHYADLNPLIQRIARLFLPGPVTLVIPAVWNFLDPIVRDGKVGLRVSSSQVIQEIMQRVNFPVSATSANLSGKATAGKIREIFDIFSDAVDLYLDAGSLDNQVSTVVDCSNERLVVLREGAVSSADIKAAAKGVME